MKILNNIYTMLITPNADLVKLIVMPLFFVESTLLLLLMLQILNIQSSKKQKILYILISSTLSIFTVSFLPEPFNTFVNYLCLYILISRIFHTNILKTLLGVFLPTTIFAIVGSLILNPFINTLHISYESVSITPIYRLLYLFIIYLCITLILFIIRTKNLKLHLLDSIDKKNKILIICNFLLGLLTICVQLVITVYYTDILPLFITFLSFISLLAYFIISIYSLTRVMKLTLTTRKLQSAEEYNNTLQILHDNVSAFKHDFDNIVTTIGGYVKTDDMEGLKKYYLQLEDDCQKVNNLYVLNPNLVNNDGIYNLLTKKYHEAESKDIKVNITFLLDLSTLKMKIYEFARILGILLDNAIEAASECEEKTINIIFRYDEKNKRQLVTIENTYLDKNVDTDKIFSKGTSGKENHSGLGLWEVRKILSKSNNANLFTSKDEKFFKQQLELY